MSRTYLTIVSKRDQRQFSDRPVAAEDIHQILDAGRVAGSARNRQPWRFFVATSDTSRGEIAPSVFVPPFVTSAAFAVALAAYTPDSRLWAFDVGRAAQNMMLAAWDRGIISCPQGVNAPDRLHQTLDLDEGWTPVSVLSFGYPEVERSADRRSADEWVARAPRRPAAETEVWLDPHDAAR